MPEERESEKSEDKDRGRKPEQPEHHAMDAGKLSEQLAGEPTADEGDIEEADKSRVKTGAKYGGRDSGTGTEGTDSPPRS